MKILGIIMAYDEADCISNAVAALRGACTTVAVFHHGHDPATRQAIQCWSQNHNDVRLIEIDEEAVPFAIGDIQSSMLWNVIGTFVRGEMNNYSWVIWQAADELLRMPDGRLVTNLGIDREARKGITVIRPFIREFWMSDADNGSNDYLERLRHYQTKPNGHAPRAWDITLTPKDIPIGLHIQDPAIRPKRFPFYGLWPVGTKVSNNEWLLDHYPARTEEQFRAKVAKRNCKTFSGEQRFSAYRNRAASIVKSHARMRYEHRDLELPCVYSE